MITSNSSEFPASMLPTTWFRTRPSRLSLGSLSVTVTLTFCAVWVPVFSISPVIRASEVPNHCGSRAGHQRHPHHQHRHPQHKRPPSISPPFDMHQPDLTIQPNAVRDQGKSLFGTGPPHSFMKEGEASLVGGEDAMARATKMCDRTSAG